MLGDRDSHIPDEPVRACDHERDVSGPAVVAKGQESGLGQARRDDQRKLGEGLGRRLQEGEGVLSFEDGHIRQRRPTVSGRAETAGAPWALPLPATDLMDKVADHVALVQLLDELARGLRSGRANVRWRQTKVDADVGTVDRVAINDGEGADPCDPDRERPDAPPCCQW